MILFLPPTILNPVPSTVRQGVHRVNPERTAPHEGTAAADHEVGNEGPWFEHELPVRSGACQNNRCMRTLSESVWRGDVVG